MGYGMMGHMFGYGYGNTLNWWWMLGFGLLRLLIIVGVIILLLNYLIKMINYTPQVRLLK